jgi:predicted GNAT family N-acyltransferase
MEVKQIDAKDTHELRHKILRYDLPKDSCNYPGDDDDGTFHLGAYVDDKLVSVASFYIDNHPDIKDEFQYRLRGMATLEEHRKNGYSLALLQTALPLIEKNNIQTLWCNARSSAAGFYEKVGFEKISDEFEIEGIGPHFLMVKKV